MKPSEQPILLKLGIEHSLTFAFALQHPHNMDEMEWPHCR